MPNPIKAKYKKGADYVVSKWGRADGPEGEHDNYECVRCQFATLRPSDMNQHLDSNDHSRHAWPKEGKLVLNEGTEDEKEVPVRGFHPLADSTPTVKKTEVKK